MAIASPAPPDPTAPAALLDTVERRLRAAGRFDIARGPRGAIRVAWDGHVGAVLRALVLDDQVSLAILAPICDEAAADADAMLDAAAGLHTGAIALVGGRYVVRLAIPAARVASAPLEQAIDAAAAAAAALIPSFDAPRRGVAAIFTHYGS